MSEYLTICKACGAPFDKALSALSLIELSKISYDPKLISDAQDQKFCNKWCEKNHKKGKAA